ncbi:hypothetical protein F4827_002540 [Paraburkholderia bannensis]|uniref:Uncharacterized protein n=1 Tax=Paraburkholderia bannensis TaxID=765414 RepID=A0A7W9WTF0_9BURK|nr:MULTISPECIES: hypothetical protein [Paraburkholderia]MBB3257675.1 hypothetical protein [Paraburkholderia sp. WP4_3_2]MBB6102688.1 hypothetical protein [Paraburkholderia bannensis]
MSDSYQAIYDAVRSRIHGSDIGQAAESALREAFGNADNVIRCAMQEVTFSLSRPSAVYRPSVGRDGNQWCALYGENIMEGVCGFGDSPEAAMADFDANWHKKIASTGAQS